MAIPDQILKGHVFTDGDTVHAADLNELVDGATVLKGMIMEQPVGTPVPSGDWVVFFDNSAADLRRCLIADLPSGVSSFALTMPAAVFSVTVTNPTGAVSAAVTFDSQTRNTFLAAPVDVAGTPTFRAMVPADMTQYILIAAFNIDLSLGNAFHKALAGNGTFRFQNGTEGQVIKVFVSQSGTGNFVAHWDTVDAGGSVRWPGGTEPVVTVGPGRIDIFTFFCAGNENYYGTVVQNFLL